MTERTPAPAAARRAVPGRAVSALAGGGIAAVLVGRSRVPGDHVPAALDAASPMLLVLGTVALTLATMRAGRARGPAGVRRRRTPSPRTRRSAGR